VGKFVLLQVGEGEQNEVEKGGRIQDRCPGNNTTPYLFANTSQQIGFVYRNKFLNIAVMRSLKAKYSLTLIVFTFRNLPVPCAHKVCELYQKVSHAKI
jgi:hypothetical protein